MALPELLLHLLNFVAPAFGVGFLTAVLARWGLPRRAGAPARSAWWVQGGINFVVGVVVLAGGLVVFGHDGAMASYAALVVACATSQWWLSGGSRP